MSDPMPSEPAHFCRRLGIIIGQELEGLSRRGAPGLNVRRAKYRALVS